MESNFTVIYDACILYPAPLRDLLMQLALTGLFQARWTDKIHDEWTRNVLKNRPDLTVAQLNRTRAMMNAAVEDALVFEYEYIIPSLELPDTDDRHVLAAAIVAKANYIITFNLKDFPASILEKYEVEAQHPDRFISDLIEANSSAVLASAKACCQRLKNPPKSAEEYLEILLKQGLSISTNMLRQFGYC
ncbi:PIN domain-containing protein [Chamaesiphon sp.]|uniref:PIN domain-containing protein n=1 Tax=Chamaesiphon sp. TaxID=2814140 RepID=UPI0035947DC9